MKHLAISLCSILMMLLLTGFSVAQQADAPAQDAAPQMDHSMPSAPADTTTQTSEAMSHKMMTATLEQMAAELSQDNVTPETVKKVADQLKQLAEQHKKMPMMSGMDKQGGMMKGGKCKMMRGEMMKAMGEILMKYGQQMEAESPQPAPTDAQHQHHQ